MKELIEQIEIELHNAILGGDALKEVKKGLYSSTNAVVELEGIKFDCLSWDDYYILSFKVTDKAVTDRIYETCKEQERANLQEQITKLQKQLDKLNNK